MADITGQRGTLNILQSQRALDVGSNISLLESDAQPLAAFSRKLNKRRTISPEFSWHEDALDQRYDATSGAVSGTTNTTIPVNTGSRFAEHDLFQNTRTGEVLRVTGVSSNNLTVATRGSINTAAAMNSGDELVVIGSAQPEGDTSKPARSTNPVKSTNYTQIFRKPYQSTGTLLASGFVHNPADWTHQTKKAGIEHAKEIELSFIHGRKSEDNTGSQPRRTTDGILARITTNSTDAGGTLSESELNAGIRAAGRYGKRNYLLLGSALAVSALNGFPMGKLQVRNDDSTYGMDVQRYIGPFGSMNLVYHPLLEGSKYGGYLIGVDMDEVSYRYLASDVENRDTHIRTNIQAPDLDGRKDEYLSEVGLEFGQEKKHFVITGITG